MTGPKPPEIRYVPGVFNQRDDSGMTPEERKAAIEMARQCERDGWNKADLADVLGALGFLSHKQVDKVAESLKLEIDPGYVAKCPGDRHPAKGNMYRAHDGRMRCRPCGQEQGVKRRLETKRLQRGG